MILHPIKTGAVCAFCATTLLFSEALADESWTALVSPENSLEFKFLKDDAQVFHLGLGGWGPKW